MWVAHSAPPANVAKGPQPYSEHVSNVRDGAGRLLESMMAFAAGKAAASAGEYRAAVRFAAEFHDLGKLDDDNQPPLQKGRGGRLAWDHIDAGVAHALNLGHRAAAWLIRAHHAPGLASAPDEELFQDRGPLRGKRNRGVSGSYLPPGFHDDLVDRTEACLTTYLARHREACEAGEEDESVGEVHGLNLRLLLSCLVDADHSDSASWDESEQVEQGATVDWAGLIERLDTYVADLGHGASDDKIQLRTKLYQAAKVWNAPTDRMFSCEAGVGLGKTTALVRCLLGYAQREQLRHLFIVAPYTTILRQTAKVLRRVWADLAVDSILAEHHHRAEFSDISSRQYSALWRAPITLTSTVQFFETLASNHPGQLRKLHELPGSGIFLDEAHAALPAALWPQAWKWLRSLSDEWGCRVGLASGSMVRFWETAEIVSPIEKLRELTPPAVVAANSAMERRRVEFLTIAKSIDTNQIAARVKDDLDAGRGPVLAILNTVQSAAAVAAELARQCDKIDALSSTEMTPAVDRCVLHLSTVLSPRDRENVLVEIERRAKQRQPKWALVATSCVEAGIDLDFQTGYRERCSVGSLIQTSGRINRHNLRESAQLYDFQIMEDGLLTRHPAFKTSAIVVGRLWSKLVSGTVEPSEMMTLAMRLELEAGGEFTETIQESEESHDYPAVARDFSIIQTDTRTVIVSREVADRVSRYEPVPVAEILLHSVQIWSDKIDKLGMVPMERVFLGSDLYRWNAPYDRNLLGIMRGLLPLAQLKQTGMLLIDNVE